MSHVSRYAENSNTCLVGRTIGGGTCNIYFFNISCQEVSPHCNSTLISSSNHDQETNL